MRRLKPASGLQKPEEEEKEWRMENIEKGYTGRTIYILSDSKAAR
jgi:hypothetical protein